MRVLRWLGRLAYPALGRAAGEKGAIGILIVTLFSGGALLGLGAIVVDTGQLYVQRAAVQNAADAAALAGAKDLPGSPGSAENAAQTLALDNAPGATVTTVTPYDGSSGKIEVTVSETGADSFAGSLRDSPPTVSATAVAENTPGTGGFVYAAATTCSAITITNSNSVSVTTLWSNGGFSATGQQVTVSGQVDEADTGCAFPSPLTPPGPTTVSSYNGWPEPLPTVAQGNLPSSCPSAAISISSSSWTSSNPPGMYCTTSTVSIINSGTLTLSGYEFVSESTSSSAISVTNSGTVTLTGYCPSTCSSGSTPRTLFYATAGGISVTNSNTSTITGDLFAPGGKVSLTVSGGTATGFVEASTMSFTNSGSTTVTGTGPTATGTSKLTG